jgi:hypothetical protein
MFFVVLSFLSPSQAEDKQSSRAEMLKPLLLKTGEAMVSETFDKGSEAMQKWVIYGTQWQVIDGDFCRSTIFGRLSSRASWEAIWEAIWRFSSITCTYSEIK